MCVVDSSDIILAYLYDQQDVTELKLMDELYQICNNLVENSIFTAIDFNFYDDRITSDVIKDYLWDFTSSKIIKEHSSELSYQVTEYGNRISDILLHSFKESSAWNIYKEILEKLS